MTNKTECNRPSHYDNKFTTFDGCCPNNFKPFKWIRDKCNQCDYPFFESLDVENKAVLIQL